MVFFSKGKNELHQYYDTIVFPKIGAGLGNGDWNKIEKIIDKTVGDKYETYLYVPNLFSR